MRATCAGHGISATASPPLAPVGGPGRLDLPPILVRVGLLTVLLALAACAPAATPRSLSGTFVLTQEERVTQTNQQTIVSSCSGNGGYSDIVEGAAVVVRDGEGATIGTGRLELDPWERTGTPDNYICRFAFEVMGLPDADFYTVEVSHRGEVTFSAADLDAQNGSVELTLGP